MIKILHNPKCKKSREGLAYLKTKTDNFEIQKYLNTALAPEELDNILKYLKLKPIDIVRTQEDYYKKELKGKTLSYSEWLMELTSHPKLIKRPIVISGSDAVIADPPEEIDKLF
ncbi:MAG: ArsC/Spx/MgsR family protein [Hyphomicrobiales bacterium]